MTSKYWAGTAAVSVFMCSVLTAPVLADQAAAMPAGEALAYLEGEWHGSGWILDRGGERREFDVFELGRIAADGQAFIVTGEGFTPRGAGREGERIHDAAGFITWTGQGYQMRAITMHGQMQDATVELTETGFDWTLDLGPHGRVVYSTEVEDGVWRETGHYCASASETCRQTFYMELSRAIAD